MKQFFTTLLIGFTALASAQTTTAKLTIKAKDGEAFFLYVNGKLQNKIASNTVTINNAGNNAAVKVQFKNKKLGTIQQRITCDETHELFVLNKNKGTYNLKEEDWEEDMDMDANISFSAGPGGFDMTIKDKDASMQTSYDQSQRSNSSSSTTTTTSYSSSPAGTTYSSSTVSSASGSSNEFRSNGYNCSRPTMSPRDFKEFEAAVKESYMDHSRINYIYKNIEKHCWQADQIAVLVKLLYSDEEQIKLAKYAYNLTYDTERYDAVIDRLSSAKKRIELREWLQGLGRPTHYPTPTPNHPTPLPDTRNCKGNYFSDNDFAEAIRSIQKIAFEETKINQIELVTQNACLSIDQVRKLIKTLTFENNKLDVAKKLYTLTYEKHKYYLVNEEFTFDHSKTELTDFIKDGGK